MICSSSLRNAVRWSANPAPAWTTIEEASNVPYDKAPEPITPRGPTLHAHGQAGFR